MIRSNLTAFASKAFPEIGMLATINYYTDCRPAEVVEIRKNGKEIVLKLMDYKFINGDYQYFHSPKERYMTYTLRKNGRYIRKGESLKSGIPCSLGFARFYEDPSF